MKGYRIDYDQINSNTELNTLLMVLEPYLKNYVWVVADVEATQLDKKGSLVTPFYENPKTILWLPHAQLKEEATSLVSLNWGAFLAFLPQEAYFEFESSQIPYSEGRPPCIQHPKAIIEIQAVDGGYFEVFSTIENITTVLAEYFELVEITI
ncbi:MAG: hypothetical protein GY810_06355 [Aureispira sp.]|nr:hypothetical protein [Aureispira sp.]